MHFFHPTPLDIVDQFITSRTKGKHFNHVLEPCVGDGALLTSLENNFDNLTIIDIDGEKLNKFQNRKYKKYEGDFLDIKFNEKFDLILCNPPFNNKSISGESIEQKFLTKCLTLIKENGSGIFILPSSIINGTKSKNIRNYILNNFTILSIDILPKNTFTKIESHFYIVSIKNLKPKHNYNIETNLGLLNFENILDNNYLTLNPKILFNLINYKKLLDDLPSFNLSKYVLFRGNTGKNESQIHTTHFSSHFCNDIKYVEVAKSGKKLEKFDLIFKRVGRNCHQSFSIYLGEKGLVISDCLVVIRSKINDYHTNLLLLINIRLSILFGASSSFMIDGSGASYIPVEKIKNTKFINFEGCLSRGDIENYSHLLIQKDLSSLLRYEEILKEHILNKIYIME